MSELKKSWTKPVLREITAQQAAKLFMTDHAEASATQLRLERDVSELTQSLADCRGLLAKCQSELGARGSGPSAAEPANANGDYRSPYNKEDHMSRTESRSLTN